MVIKPYGYAKKMQAELDRMFKERRHQNAYFPYLLKSMFEAEEKMRKDLQKNVPL
jgi:prolyl-tRNA synthetase